MSIIFIDLEIHTSRNFFYTQSFITMHTHISISKLIAKFFKTIFIDISL